MVVVNHDSALLLAFKCDDWRPVVTHLLHYPHQLLESSLSSTNNNKDSLNRHFDRCIYCSSSSAAFGMGGGEESTSRILHDRSSTTRLYQRINSPFLCQHFSSVDKKRRPYNDRFIVKVPMMENVRRIKNRLIYS